MKNRIIYVAILCTSFVCMLPRTQQAFGQTIPPDTTHEWVRNSSGVTIAVRRPPDSLMLPGKLVIRFRDNALNYNELEETYDIWYRGSTQHDGGKGKEPLSGPPTGMRSDVRNFAVGLRELLFSDRFSFGSSSNVIQNPALKGFLIAMGGHDLRRFTAASPWDTVSVTRNNDTIGCDLRNWMILSYDSTRNPIQLAYLLMTIFPHDIISAEPDYRNIVKLFSDTAGDLLYHTCQKNNHIINLEAAWDYEVGDSNIQLAFYDYGCDYRHPDFGDPIVGPHHKFTGAWQYAEGYDNDNVVLQAGHGTPTAGIMAGLTNNLLPLPFLSQSTAGVAGGWGKLPPDSISRGRGASMVILGDYAQGSAVAYARGVFEAAARSSVTAFGWGVNAINSSAGITAEAVSDVYASVNYAYLNAVVQVGARGQTNNGAARGTDSIDAHPACWDEPWIISVAGCDQNKYSVYQSDWGYTLDLLAPSGNGTLPCVDPASLNWATHADSDARPYHGPLDSAKYKFGEFAGNSAAAPNVTGAVGLLQSHFFHRSPLDFQKIEPEDYADILKAAAYRMDTSKYKPMFGWGVLDIGKAFEMLDPDLSKFDYSGYQIRHYSFTDSLQYGDWQDSSAMLFFVPTNPFHGAIDTVWKYSNGKRYQLNYVGGNDIYGAKMRSVTRTVTLQNIWDLTDTSHAPLFAWGRGGTIKDKSGWSPSTQNWQTGFSRVVNGYNGDSLNEGIFHSNSVTFKVETEQYDVWGEDSITHKFTVYLGHCPPDSLLGVNFTVYGRVDSTFADVRKPLSVSGDNFRVVYDANSRMMTAHFFSRFGEDNSSIQVFDMLGRRVAMLAIPYIPAGENTYTIPVNRASGAYICTISNAGKRESKRFEIVR